MLAFYPEVLLANGLLSVTGFEYYFFRRTEVIRFEGRHEQRQTVGHFKNN